MAPRPSDRAPLWTAGRHRTPRPALEGDLETDVVVVGAGIAGLTVADELSRAGREVMVLEHRTVGAGATGSTTAKATSLHGATYRTLTRHHGQAVAARGLPEGVAVATGFGKWGMTNGTLAGRLLADAVLGRPQPPWADAFDASRLPVARSARRFLTLNAEVAGRMVAGHASSILAHPPDRDREGSVVRGTATARIDGRSCAVSGICPHLGGVLAWNPLERSWDCPLHGSRFAADGALLQGPAVKDLEPRDGPETPANPEG